MGGTSIETTSTTYQATGLTAGTTYYFEVVETAGSIQSSPSNVASATTTGTPPAGDTIWPNSYTGATTGFFGPGGFTSGPLTAEGTTQGDGVYNSSGAFPNHVDNGVNFWADLAFTPTSTSIGVPAHTNQADLASTSRGAGSGTSAAISPAGWASCHRSARGPSLPFPSLRRT